MMFWMHELSCRIPFALLACALSCVASLARGQTAPATAPVDHLAPPPASSAPAGLRGPERVPWAELNAQSVEQLTAVLKDPNWPIRVFGLLRLERYSGDEPQNFVRAALSDEAWQVRCFAIRQASHMRIDIAPAALAEEMDPHVLRAALRHGVAIPAEQIEPHAKRLLKTRGIEELLLGLELAACSDIEEVRTEAEKRATRLIKNMEDGVALLIARRLAVVVGLDAPPEDGREWRAWLASTGEKVTLASPEASRRAGAHAAAPLIAEIDDEVFTRLLDYLSSLKQRDLDLVIVMDATASMIPMVNSARAGVDALILFMSDISRSMRLAFIAYRDHDNAPVWDGHPFTTDIASIRKYLFDLRITGGADYPEAVLEGLTACAELTWNKKAEREIVLVGDAPPHEEDLYKVRELLDTLRNSGITVHAVHVPMQYPKGYFERLAPERADAARQWLQDYHESTGKAFADIADGGGGKKAELTRAEELVPAVMHFTIEEAWWSVFDEFYGMYLELCR
jgi:Mg-chelatase subunit ChlD